MRIMRVLSGLGLLIGAGPLGMLLTESFEIAGYELYASALTAFIGGMLFYSGLPFVGKKTVRVGRF